MLTISRQTDYACRVILHLAMLSPGTRVTSREIAARRIIPRALVRRIITLLGKAHLIRTTRGMGGGIALARPADKISLLDVTLAMEGAIALNACVTNPHKCPLMKVCTVHQVWMTAHARLFQQLSRAKFDKLARRNKAKVKS
jgi:Rrf2 family protein